MCAFVYVYTLLPLGTLRISLTLLCYGDIDEDNEFHKIISLKMLLLWKLFENVGEALLQFVLGIVYVANNYGHVHETETTWGFQVPITIISLIFSLGNFIIGMFSGVSCVVNA